MISAWHGSLHENKDKKSKLIEEDDNYDEKSFENINPLWKGKSSFIYMPFYQSSVFKFILLFIFIFRGIHINPLMHNVPK